MQGVALKFHGPQSVARISKVIDLSLWGSVLDSYYKKLGNGILTWASTVARKQELKQGLTRKGFGWMHLSL